MKKIIAAVLVIALIGAGVYFFTRDAVPPVEAPAVATSTVPVATTTAPTNEKVEVIGKSAGGRDIVAYHFGAPAGARVGVRLVLPEAFDAQPIHELSSTTSVSGTASLQAA